MQLLGVKFEDNNIPFDYEKTFGTLSFVGVSTDKFEADEDGQRTDKVKFKRCLLLSELQRSSFPVDLPSHFDLDAFSNGDTVVIEGISQLSAWAMQQDGSLATGFRIIAKSLRKKETREKKKDN